jgi:Family of unknown function (DUF6064)
MPFTINDFLGVFKEYNAPVFPFQLILFTSALYIIYLTFSFKKYSNRIISLILTFYWLWIGVVYHMLFFSIINPAANIFGAIFILQGILFLKVGFIDKNMEFEISKNWKTYTGSLFVLYALIIYPVLGYIAGHIYPESPTFGLPCPTVIFTFGILLWAKNKIPIYILIIPFIWSIIGISAAINLGIKEDFGLIAAGLIGSIFIISEKIKDRNTIKA